MSLATEETTFRVGKPLSSAQPMPEEGRVNALRAPRPAGRGRVPEPGGSHQYPTGCEILTCSVSLWFSLTEGLTGAITKIR